MLPSEVFQLYFTEVLLPGISFLWTFAIYSFSSFLQAQSWSIDLSELLKGSANVL
jgi:hypothetical protein